MPWACGGRAELDLLVERQLLVHTAHVTAFQVGALELEPELEESVQDPLLRG